MDIQTFITEWITASNMFDAEKYLSFYLFDAILDDPSVGRKFQGHKEIRKYFDDYFIGYNTHTDQVELTIIDQQNAHLVVQFSGDFPEGKIGGTFEFKFKNDKISSVNANLIH
ncbi:hypothetical protein CA265_04510 [Sphingobacteriaceae bacterium GW460-11-11-14-LB5]|nr:hypothetical protein CA265_04510 [Sphingobacteriaceae bacterium GW460-11-11-14-LB5]